ncbi:hypothetical protein H310_05466 [Aphanomyces invadans]|uniref:Uncharacterized protein n=1 Tax=Aphanomyces invadans TaxID=157072 RepID=A0A024U9Z5_9STRA|nr:hypothetical protein H310_05466 [Aphanomyces invadans]ETW03035.1 hypothetical protein H310_05466 [Aphanomyces invadans]|eukprot:XP_008868419.1 hypothetical protein H310_05466 [Aphanomyces invadans]
MNDLCHSTKAPMMLNSRKRPCPEWSTPSTKAAKPFSFAQHATNSCDLPTAFLCIRQLQARTLERFRRNGDWDTARNLLFTMEQTRRVVVQARRKAVLARISSVSHLARAVVQSPTIARKCVSFSDVMVVHEAVAMDRTNSFVEEPPQADELLLVRTMGQQATPLANFSELW